MNALIVEDSPAVADRLEEMLTEVPGVHVVAKVGTADSGVAACDRFAIDLAVIDLQLHQGTGYDVIRHLRRASARPAAVIVLTNHAVPALKVAAFEAGADYFLDKAKDFLTVGRIAAGIAREGESQEPPKCTHGNPTGWCDLCEEEALAHG